VGPDFVFFQNPQGKARRARVSTKFRVSDKFLATHEHLNAATEPKWRHLAFVLDARDDTVSFYIDGHLGWSAEWGSRVDRADCAARELSFGRSFPGWTNGLEVDVYDLKMFVGEALSAGDVLLLAKTPGELLKSEDLCVDTYYAATTPVDSLWRDDHGRDCHWYASHRHQALSICEQEDPKVQCPVACMSYQPCYVPQTVHRHYQLWDRIQTIQKKTSTGALCLDSHGRSRADKDADTKLACEAWVRAGKPGDYEADWRTDFEGALGVRIDFYNDSSVCEAVVAALDEECAFDSALVRNFTADVALNGGNMTISFWVRPIDEASFIGKQFLPHLAFYSSLFPPEHNLVIGAFESNADGEIRLHSQCRDKTAARIFESVHMNPAAAKGWTSITYVRKSIADVWANKVVVDLGTKELKTKQALCLFDPKGLFRAIEVNYPMYMTPIRMYPEALSVEQLQRTFYKLVDEMAMRSGMFAACVAVCVAVRVAVCVAVYVAVCVAVYVAVCCSVLRRVTLQTCRRDGHGL